MIRLPRRRDVVVGTAAAVFVATCVLPLAYLLVSAVDAGSYRVVMLDRRQRDLLVNSGLLGLGTAALAVMIGAPLGMGLARVRLTQRAAAAARIVLAAPLFLPPYGVALAWIYVGGSAGIAAQFFGRDVLSTWTYSLRAASVLLALVYYPLVMLATEAAVRRVDPRLEEAALTAASRRRVLVSITLPLAAPAIAGAGLVVFVLGVSEFSVPGLLRVRVYTTEILTAFAALYDFGRATALATPLVLLTAVVTTLSGRLIGDRLITSRRAGGGPPSLALAQRPYSFLALAAVLVLLALVLPVAVLAYEAFKSASPLSALAGSWPSVRISVLLSAASATLIVMLAWWLAYGRARASTGTGIATDILLVTIFAVPSTVVGIGLIGLWNRSGVFGAVYGTIGMLVLASLARFVPVAVLAIAASIRQVSESQEEAAAISGAGWLRTIGCIVGPQCYRGVAAAWIVAFVLTFGELGASILVAPPGDSTLPIRIYTLIANAPSATVAALALLQVGVMLTPLALVGWYLGRRRVVM
jgi:iron(III) transport system permease protein